MSNDTHHFRNAAATVDRAVEIATKLVGELRGSNGISERALRIIATDSRIGFSQLRRLAQPSRRPSSISADVWYRLNDCYLRFLRRKLAELEVEIARVEALHRPDDSALRALVDEAEALTARIKALL